MLRKTRLVLAAAFILASTSVIFAEDAGSSLTNKLTAATARGGYELSSRNVAWHYHRRHHHHRHRGYFARGARSGSWMNRASRVWDGGGK
jgi:hypothetical protein